eukprot:6478184-Prymnesium_polylepis.1
MMVDPWRDERLYDVAPGGRRIAGASLQEDSEDHLHQICAAPAPDRRQSTPSWVGPSRAWTPPRQQRPPLPAGAGEVAWAWQGPLS